MLKELIIETQKCYNYPITELTHFLKKKKLTQKEIILFFYTKRSLRTEMYGRERTAKFLAPEKNRLYKFLNQLGQTQKDKNMFTKKVRR